MVDASRSGIDVDRIGGWLTPGESDLLFEKARACPAGTVIVEIGSYKGRSTIRLAEGSRAGAGVPVYAIDPHVQGSKQAFFENIERAGVADLVVPVVARSDDAVRDWKHPIGLLFIDGAHELPFVERDFTAWFPHVIEGGVVALHDTTAALRHKLLGYPGPRYVAARYLFASDAVHDVTVVDTTTLAVKGPPREPGDHRRRAWVRTKKALPDSLTIINHHVVGRVPDGLRRRAKRLVFGKTEGGSGGATG